MKENIQYTIQLHDHGPSNTNVIFSKAFGWGGSVGAFYFGVFVASVVGRIRIGIRIGIALSRLWSQSFCCLHDEHLDKDSAVAEE